MILSYFIFTFEVFLVLFCFLVLNFYCYFYHTRYNSGLTLRYFIFSLHVKALLARTVLFVFLNMNGTPITVTVSLDSVELTVNEEVYIIQLSFSN